MSTVHFAGKMIDGSLFNDTANADKVIAALNLELAGDDIATDDFIANQFDVDAGIAVKAMTYESTDFIKSMIDIVENGGRFAVKGLVTEFGSSLDPEDAKEAFYRKEF